MYAHVSITAPEGSEFSIEGGKPLRPTSSTGTTHHFSICGGAGLRRRLHAVAPDGRTVQHFVVA